MGLGVSEIRGRAERLKAALARERYETKAGLRSQPSFEEVYASQEVLVGEEAIPAIQRELAEAVGDDERRLRYLLAWVAEQRVRAAVAPLEDEYRAWEAASVVRLDGREIPFRDVPRALANEPDRGVRMELERRRATRLEEATPLLLDLLHRERQAVSELGFGDYVEARERLSGLNVRGIERQAVRIVAGTEDAYREHFAYQVRGRLGIDPAGAVRSDALRLERTPWLEEAVELRGILGGVRRDLGELGLPLRTDDRVTLDLEPRPLKAPDSTCVPIRVPEEVVLLLAPVGGWKDADGLLHELGHALHFSYTDPALPFEYRALGDGAVTEAYALLFQLLDLEPGWASRSLVLAGNALDEYLLLAGFLQLHRLRTQAGRLLFQLELLEAETTEGMDARYAEIMSGVTGFRHDPRTWLEDLDRGFWVARQLRAWMLRAALRTVLRDRYDEDWYRNPSAGPFLGELFSEGQREDAARLAVELGAERLRGQALIDQAGEWLR